MTTGEEWFKLGQQFRAFVASDGARDDLPKEQFTTGRYGSTRVAPLTGPQEIRVVGKFNRGARLRSGWLLVNLIEHNTCYQVDPVSGVFEYLFSLWHEQEPFVWRVLADRDHNIYCTLSGTRDRRSPTNEASFGVAGAVVRVNVRSATVDVLASGDYLLDPCGLQLTEGGELVVCDFGGFGSTGAVYGLNPTTREIRRRAEGGLLRDPVSAYLEGDGTIWVANAYMHYEYPERGGVVEKDNGEIIKIDPSGRQTVVVPRQSPATGSIVGIHASSRSGEMIAVTGDWPMLETGSVIAVDKATGKTRHLLRPPASEPCFYSTHIGLSGDILWVGEAYKKQLIAYDLAKDAVVKTIGFAHISGGHIGVTSSFEGMESVSTIP